MRDKMAIPPYTENPSTLCGDFSFGNKVKSADKE